jgi:predicted DCC family thiol-disulfide oxidoreductase YuxK
LFLQVAKYSVGYRKLAKKKRGLLKMEIDKNASTVLFDGSCPLCTLEINQYKAITPIGQINWVDVSSPEFIPPIGQSKEVLMQRFHVIKPNGELISGAAAFVHIWEKLPGWRRLAAIAKLPGAINVMEFGYVKFLKIRPKVQSLFKKRAA